MPENKKIAELKNQMNSLTQKLSKTGLLLHGTITERTIRKNNGNGKKYGPYYQWTFKKNAKTVTVNLSSDQIGEFQKAIDNNKEAESIMEKLRNISREILELSTQGVSRRKLNK